MFLTQPRAKNKYKTVNTYKMYCDTVKVAPETYTNTSQQFGTSMGKSVQLGGLGSVKMVYVPRNRLRRFRSKST